jgi:putative ABC transport system permease protein
MIQHYFKIALRNLLKNWSYSLINIIGLSAGLAACIFILLFVMHELSYDRFHAHADRIYRMGVQGQMAENSFNQAVTASPMAQAMLEDYPEIEQVTRLKRQGAWLVRYGDKKFNEEYFYFADSTFFKVFSFNLLKGNPSSALTKPRSVVMTKQAAKRYFGKEDPMGKTLRVESDTAYYTVTGVMEDVPPNSHVHFDMIGSLNTLKSHDDPFWLNHNYYTYVLLKEGTDPRKLESKFDLMVDKYVGAQVQQMMGVSLEDFLGKGNAIVYFMQPLTDIHLKSHLQYEIEANSDIKYIYIFSVIAIFILIMASINYTNLATAKSASRSLEIGIRKVSGATGRMLRQQFLIESVLLTFIALVFAIILVEILLPSFNNLVGLKLDVYYISSWYILPVLIMLVVLVGIMAGSYPAFFLSSFHPVSVLKGKFRQGTKSASIRKVLVISQFVISIAILLATYTVYDQLNYMQSKDPGFGKKNILVVRRSDGLKNKMEAFKQEVLKYPNIMAVSNSMTMPGHNFSNNAFFLPGSSNTKLLHQAWISFDYEKVFDFQMDKGRFFSRDYPSDSNAIVINQKAAEYLGFNDDPLGKMILRPKGRDRSMQELKVIGVVEDFHFKSMHIPIEPACFTMMGGNWEGYVFVKITGNNRPQTIRNVQDTWESFTSEYPFEYFFFSNDYNRLYHSEYRTQKILLVFSILSLLIASLGLLGLISFTTVERQKEIGIRKSFGSTTRSILLLLNREIVMLVLFSMLIAWPVAFYSMQRWLQDFAYRTEIDYLMFLVIPFVMLVLSLLIVSYQSFYAAGKNPASILRDE